ncbi:hypothetical protein J1605_008320 [Eschrichtius robustus]|uniref:Uncharacterized protein n=1 Tax=Eschrichtius robustus TaxID=9764 RepID=A0AB34H0A9_ESCRO|nr:hypothetical protein J1605_008320 [Eschrichtius robustus]
MWALRAAVRSGPWFSRVVRGCRAPRAAPLLPPCPVRALATFRGGLGGPEGRGPRADGRGSRTGGKEDEEEPEDAEEEDEEEEELLRRDPLLPAGTQRVCLVHPDVKWGPGKPQGTRGDQDCGRRLGGGVLRPKAVHKRVHTPFVAETVNPAESLSRLGPASMALGHQQPHCARPGRAGGTADTPGRSPPPDLSAVFRTQQEGGRTGAGTGPSHQGGPGWPGETDPTDE